MFFINVPIVLLADWALHKLVPVIAPKNPAAKFDGAGATLLIAASSMIVCGIVQASEAGMFMNSTTMGLVGIGSLLAGAYVVYALRRPNIAVMPLRLFKHRNFTGAMIANVLVGFITSGPMILLPLYFQDVRGESIVLAAVVLIPQSIGMLVSRGTIGRLIDTLGARWVVLIGVTISVASTLPFVYFTTHSAYWLIAVVVFVRGIGGATVKSAIQADAYVGIDRADSSQASLGSKLFEKVGSPLAQLF